MSINNGLSVETEVTDANKQVNFISRSTYDKSMINVIVQNCSG